MILTWRELFTLLFECEIQDWGARYEYACKALVHKASASTAKEEGKIRQWVQNHGPKIRQNWERYSRSRERFLASEQVWLDSTLQLEIKDSKEVVKQEKPTGGRPCVSFEKCAPRTKRLKTEALRKSNSTDELCLAATMKLRSDGRVQEAHLMQEALNTSPTRAKKINRAWKKSQKSSNTSQSFTPAEALALMVDADLTKFTYKLIRSELLKKGVNVLPSYNRVQTYKRKCYPPKEVVEITEKKAEVQLQGLLDLTAARIVESIDDVVRVIPKPQLDKCLLISKLGFDGSSKQIMYKQKSEDDSLNDSSLFLTCLVPLRLQTDAAPGTKSTVLWQNPRPSSTRFCRPVKMEFVHETTDVIKAEHDNLEEQIHNLGPTKIQTSTGEEINISHSVAITMIDGKTCNALTGTKSAQSCNLCGATPSVMNDLEKIKERSVNSNALSFGLSTLHAYIRFLEWMLHLSYRLTVKVWRSSAATKAEIDSRKCTIQKQFRERLGLYVDVVKQGFGTSNDGNTARRFFHDPRTTSEITGIDESLIHRCQIILRTLSCGYDVHPKLFEAYAFETASLYVKLYPWYPMPASAHKVLMHGSQVLQECVLPIGMYSEEAQEGCNKVWRRMREYHTRKTSRTDTNQDLLNAMLVSSDPLLSSSRKIPPRKDGSLSSEIIQLLAPPEPEERELDSSGEEDH